MKFCVIDASLLRQLDAYCDNEATGHVCIVPQETSRMQEWIDSRGVYIRPFTAELLNAIVPA